MTYINPVFPGLVFALLLLALRVRPWRRNIWLALAVALFLWSVPAFAWLTSGTLEWWYPVKRPAGDPGAIVVLSEGERSPPHPSEYEPLPSFSTYLRGRYAAFLYKNWRTVPVVVSGGRTPDEDFAVADVLRHVIAAEGVPADGIWVEDQSSSTYENAVNVARLLRPRGIRTIALVTEAHHMLRSEMCFRKQGFQVIAAPCGYRTLEYSWEPSLLLPGPGSISRNDDALHEWGGLLWYWLRGRV